MIILELTRNNAQINRQKQTDFSDDDKLADWRVKGYAGWRPSHWRRMTASLPSTKWGEKVASIGQTCENNCVVYIWCKEKNCH